MSFRKIRPSLRENSAASMVPSVSTPEYTGSDPRRVRNEDEADAINTFTTSAKRRRVPESVTRNACLNCKKARAKCDGKKPCKRCATRTETLGCIYEVHIKHAKEELVKQIKDLMTKDHLTDQILQALSTEDQVPEILTRLKQGETYEGIVAWLGRFSIDGLSPKESYSSVFDASDNEMGGPSATNFQWTTVTSDAVVLDHLFQLYFAWVHPVHTLFSEGHFVDSYKRLSNTYCSSILVNALCAMACHLHTASETDEVDFEHLGRDFSDAVRAQIDFGNRSITTIQTSAVMFLVLSAHSEGLRAASYLKIATIKLSNFEHPNIEGFQDVWKNTVRGVQNLNGEWAQAAFHVPPSIMCDPLEESDNSDTDLDDARWYFYRDASGECPAWPGLLATTNRLRSKLIEIINDVTTMMYTQDGPPITARQVLRSYTKLVAWREELPDVITSFDDETRPPLPHVLSLLIMFENAAVHLLRPLLDLRGFPVATVEGTIWNHAQQGLNLLDRHYRTKYSCRYQPYLQMFSILHLTDVVARFFPGGVEGPSKDGPDALTFGLEALLQSQVGFPVAGPFREMLRRTAKECSIRLPKDLDDFSASRRPSHVHVYKLNDMIDACTMPSYAQPVIEIHKKYPASFSADWLAEAHVFGFPTAESSSLRLEALSMEEKAAQNLMQIRNLLNSS